MTTSNPRFSRLHLLLGLLLASVLAYAADSYVQTPNAAIPGHNTATLTGVTVDACKAACSAEKKFQCKSFDYDRPQKRCDLSDKNAADAGGLKRDYPGNPYHHYERQGIVAAAATPPAAATPSTAKPAAGPAPKVAAGPANPNRVCEEKDLIRDSDKYFGDVCYSQTQTRGAGTIPTVCPAGTESHAGMCYTQCRAGYRGAVTMCAPECPAGFRDDGLHCAKGAPYGRGAGYPWVFGDPLNDNGMIQRCEAENGRGNCEKNGLVFYPRCKAGFVAIGANVCSPQCPANTIDIGVSCQKNTYDRGVGKVPVCSANLVNDAGLCYQRCAAGTTGIGPVCWADKCPANFPVKCGALCGRNAEQCAKATTVMVTSPFKAVASTIGTVLTAGASGAATAAVENAEREAYKQLRIASIKTTLQNRARNQLQCTLTEEAALVAATGLESYERWQGTTDVMARLDPTSISAIIDSYAKPVCGK